MCDLIYTSGDVLNIALAAAIAIIAILLAWAMFYVAMMLRGVFRIVRDLEFIVKETKKAVGIAKIKAEAGVYLLKTISKGVKEVIGVFEKKTENQKKKAKTKSKK